MINNTNKIKKLVKNIVPEITEIRRAIHAHPEIACKEFKTAELIKKELSNLDIKILPHFLETDVVAIMTGKNKGKNVALRADMDALPLQEKTNLPYSSKIDNMMHACGHDGHTAMLIGAAKILNQLKDSFDGSVRFVFQPGEENVAAGKDLVEAGALLNPPPDVIFALHCSNSFDVGTIAGKKGIASAASDKFNIKIVGQGGHACVPNMSINPITIGNQILESLQGIITREFSSHDPIVLTITAFQSGTNYNVIPDTAEIKGTVRSLSADISNKMKKRIEDTVKCNCDLMGAKYEFEYQQPYIPVINDNATVEFSKKIVENVLNAKWNYLEKPMMGGEDFAYYLTDYPGAFLRLGIGKDRPVVHNSLFDFNDDALYYGILFFVFAALESLK